ncbi:MAG: hypothetical protein ACOYOH_26905, partial [Paracraurococcus sp.]
MDPDRLIRFYVSVPVGSGVSRDLATLVRLLARAAHHGCGGRETPVQPRPVDLPSANVIAPPELSLGLAPEREVIAFVDTLRNAAAFVRQLQQGGSDVTAGIDLPMAPQSWWCPGQGPAYFGDRAEANLLMQATALPDPSRTDLVNIVIIDQGLPKNFPFAGPRGGWSVKDPVAKEERQPFEGTGR